MSYNFLLAFDTPQTLHTLANDCNAARIANNVETYFNFNETTYNPNCGQWINIIIRLTDSDVAWLDNLQNNISVNINNRYKNSSFFSKEEIQEIIDSAITDYASDSTLLFDGGLLFSYDSCYFGNDPENINYFHLKGTCSFNDEIDYFLTKENMIRLLFLAFPHCVHIIGFDYIWEGDSPHIDENQVIYNGVTWYLYSYDYDTETVPVIFFTNDDPDIKKEVYDRSILIT